MIKNLIGLEPEELVRGDKELPPLDLSRELVAADDPILRQELEDFDFETPPERPERIAHILAHTCINHDGLGLACNQIGLPYRACIITGQPMLCMFNPIIVGESEEEGYMEEGCLTFPNLIVKVKRPEVVRVRFTLPNGETTTRNFQGITSRVVQHEIDHLNGILFMDLATDYHLAQAKNKRKKLRKKK